MTYAVRAARSWCIRTSSSYAPTSPRLARWTSSFSSSGRPPMESFHSIYAPWSHSTPSTPLAVDGFPGVKGRPRSARGDGRCRSGLLAPGPAGLAGEPDQGHHAEGHHGHAGPLTAGQAEEAVLHPEEVREDPTRAVP